MRKLLFGLPLALIFLAAGCSKDNTSDSAKVKFYYQATIGGADYKVEIPYDNMNANLISGANIAGMDEVVFTSYVTDLGDNGTGMIVEKGLMADYHDATTSDFKDFFGVGPHQLAIAGLHGVWIDWRDENGDIWTTKNGNDQTGSTFNIVNVEEYDGPSELKVTIQFNCKLYDGLGNFKSASGTYVGVFKMY